MNKMCAVISISLLLPALVSAEIIPFGQLKLEYNVIKSNGVKQYDFNDRGSRIGIKGVHYLGGELEARYLFEAESAVADQDEIFGEVRQAWLGMRGDFGEVRVGRHLSPTRIALDSIELFEDQAADQNTVLESDVIHESSLVYINRYQDIGYALAVSSDEGNDNVSVDV